MNKVKHMVLVLICISLPLGAQSVNTDIIFGSPIGTHLFIPDRTNLFISANGIFQPLGSDGNLIYGGMGLLTLKKAINTKQAYTIQGGPVLIRSTNDSFSLNGFGIGWFPLFTLLSTPSLQILSFLGPRGFYGYSIMQGDFIENVDPEVYISSNLYDMALITGLQIDQIFRHWICSYFGLITFGGAYTDFTVHNQPNVIVTGGLEGEGYWFVHASFGFDITYRPLGVALSSIVKLNFIDILYNLMIRIPIGEWQ